MIGLHRNYTHNPCIKKYIRFCVFSFLFKNILLFFVVSLWHTKWQQKLLYQGFTFHVGSSDWFSFMKLPVIILKTGKPCIKLSVSQIMIGVHIICRELQSSLLLVELNWKVICLWLYGFSQLVALVNLRLKRKVLMMIVMITVMVMMVVMLVYALKTNVKSGTFSKNCMQ